MAKKAAWSVKFIIIPEVGDLVGMIKMGIMVFSGSVRLTSRQSKEAVLSSQTSNSQGRPSLG